MKTFLVAALALGTVQATQATASLDTRNATVHLAYGGGFATAGKYVTVGSLDPIDLSGPASLQQTGADSFTGDYLGWAVSWQMDWQVQQTWALDPTQHTLSGSGFTQLAQSSAVTGPGCSPCAASVAMTARNWQDFQFTLDAPTAYVFHSEVCRSTAGTTRASAGCPSCPAWPAAWPTAPAHWTPGAGRW
jgi:hypothetical protein